MELLKTFSDGSTLTYDQGSFDRYCVYLARPKDRRAPPRDVQYFTQLQRFGKTHGVDKVYSDFVWVYAETGRVVESRIMAAITEKTTSYGPDALEADIVFSVLHAAMVAEENKANTRLGKRVKRLGVHQLLIEDMSPQDASKFSVGMSAPAIAAECERRGF